MLAGHGPATERVARFFAAPFIALRVPPNVLTVFGTMLFCVPAGFLVHGDFLWGGVTLLLVAGFDMVDGAVARATGRVTRFGGYLDSVLDRVADASVLIALGIGSAGGLRWWAVIGAGLVGQYLTSYAKARAYEAGNPPTTMWRQVFERPERILFLVLLLIGVDIAARVLPEIEVLFWGLVIYASLALVTAFVRVVRVYRFLEETDK